MEKVRSIDRRSHSPRASPRATPRMIEASSSPTKLRAVAVGVASLVSGPCSPRADEEELNRAVAHQTLARDYLPRLFSNDPKLTSLALSKTACSDVALVALTDSLKLNTTMQQLVLDDNDITDEGARLLADALFVNRSVVELSLKNNFIGTRGAQYLISALEANDQLTVCDMEGNERIDDDALRELGILTNLNAKPHSLKKIILDLKRNVAEPFLNLSRAELARSEFRELYHNARDHLDDWAAEALAFYLATNQTVQHVDLSFHHIGDEGARHLSEMLKQNRYIDKLNLQGNAITVVGADAFIDALRVNNSCRYVCLLKNPISQSDVIRVEWAAVLNRQPLVLKPLIPLMASNDPTLSEVILDVSASQRYFDDVTGRLVSDALRHNHHVTHLSITNSKVTAVGARFLADLLTLNEALTSVDFSGNSLGNDGVAYLASAFHLNRSVTILRLSDTCMGDDGAMALAEMIKHNATLVELDVGHNQSITAVGGSQLVAALNCNTTLLELNVDGTSVGGAVSDDLNDRKKLNSEPEQVRNTISQLFSTSVPAKSVNLCGKGVARKLQDSSMRLVAEGVESNYTATSIDVSHNQLSIVGLASLFMALFENKGTTCALNLSYNRVADALEFARYVSRLLQSHQTLASLNISGMGLTDAAVNRIAQVMDTEQSFPIREIIIDDNPEVSAEVRFNLHVLVRLNTLQIRLKDIVRPLWTKWKECLEEKRDFPIHHLGFRKYNAASDDPSQEADRVDDGAELLCDVLRHIEGVTSIDYSENNLGDVGAAHFARLLLDKTTRTRIVSLNLSKNRLTDVGVSLLKTAAESNHQLLELDVSGNISVSSKLCAALNRTVLYNRQSPHLQEVLVRVSNDDPTLHTLSFETPSFPFGVEAETETKETSPEIGDDQILLVSEGLQRNTHISTIDLSHSHITWKSVGVLLDTLVTNMSTMNVDKLILRNLMLSEDDSTVLCTGVGRLLHANQDASTAIEGFHPLRHVDIGCNYVKSNDLHILLEALSRHKHLEFFGAANCGLNETELLRLQLSVAKNKPCQEETRDVLNIARSPDPDVTSLVATHQELNNILVVDICEALTMSNSFITLLDVSENDLSDAATSNSLNALAHNASLTQLSLCRNHVGDASIQALIAFLAVNRSLLYLDLRHNSEMSIHALQTLKDQAIASNDTIRRIDISDEDELRQYSEMKRRQSEGLISRLPPMEAPAAAAGLLSETHSWGSSLDIGTLSDLRSLKVYFAEQLSLNQQLAIKKCVPLVRSNDPTVGSIYPFLTEANGCDNAAQLNQQGLHNDIGCEHLAEALLYNEFVTDVDLSNGLVTDRGCIALSRALMVNRSVTGLNLSKSRIGDDGVSAICSVLQVNPVLQRVDLSDSRKVISPATLDRLRTVMIQNDTVRNLQVEKSNKSSASSRRSDSASSSRLRIVPRVPSAGQQATSASLGQLRFASALNNMHLGLKNFVRNESDGFLSREINCANAAADGGRCFDRSACRILCAALADDSFVTSLNLSDNALDESSAQMIASLLERNVSITSVDLSGNPISDGANALHDSLIKNHSVTSLKLERCQCQPLILEKISLLLQLNQEHIAFKFEMLDVLKKNETHVVCRTNVEHMLGLEVRGLPGMANRKQQLDDASMELVSTVLRADLIVTKLDFAWNAIGDSGFHTILLLLKRNKGITDVDLGHNLITDESVKLLERTIGLTPSLRSIDLTCNLLTLESVPVLVRILRNSPTLLNIGLGGNRIGPKDQDMISFFGRLNSDCSTELRQILTQTFDIDPTRTKLDFNSFYSCGNWNPNGSTMQMLCFSLLSNSVVTTLELEFNDINDKQFVALCNLFKMNRSIRSVNLANNLIQNIDPLTDGCAFGLEKLSLRKNRLETSAAIALSKMLPRNETMVELDVSNNLWGRAGVSIICSALVMNQHLSAIEVEGDGVPTELVEQTKFALTLNYRNVVLPCPVA